MRFVQVAELARSLDARSFVARFPHPALVPLDILGPGGGEHFDTPDRGTSLEGFGAKGTKKKTSSSDLDWCLATHDEGDEPGHEPGPAVEDSTPTSSRSLPAIEQSEVFFVAKTMRNPFAQMITIGRSRNNDIILDERSVSKVHAYFLRRPDGTWALHDQPSKNGTYLRGASATEAKVPTKGLVVRDGNGIRFGTRCAFGYYEPAALHRRLTLPRG